MRKNFEGEVNCRKHEGRATSVNSKLIRGHVGRKASEVIVIRNYNRCDDGHGSIPPH